MRRMLWGAGALVVVVAVAVGAWLLWRPSPDRTAEDCATARGMWDRYYTANEEFVLPVIERDDVVVIGGDDDGSMRTAPLGVLSGAVVVSVTGSSPR